jgi:hypothetical protein
VRAGLASAKPVEVDGLRCLTRTSVFTPKPLSAAQLDEMAAQRQAIIETPGARDGDRTIRMATVELQAFESLAQKVRRGEPVELRTQLQGIRLGPLAFLGTPLEIFQAIKNDVLAGAHCPIPLVMGLCNDALGYATDRRTAAKGGYAADIVPLILGRPPYAAVHDELRDALLAMDKELS